MTVWGAVALLTGVALVCVASVVISRQQYRHHRVVLGTAAVAWAGGVWAVLTSLRLTPPTQRPTSASC